MSKHKQYCLRIVTNKRSFVCSAPDEDTLLQWIDALQVGCARVAREAKLEKQREEEDLYHDDDEAEDDAVLSDPRALGRTAHLDPNGNSPISPPPTVALASSAQSTGSQTLKSALKLDTSTNHGSTSGIAFSASPIGPPSATFQGPPPRNSPTVTFSV